MNDKTAPPVATAKAVAQTHQLDQVVIIGRRHRGEGFETVTTYGRTDDDARVCDLIAHKFKTQVMRWEEDEPDEMAERVRRGRASDDLVEALQGVLIALRNWTHMEDDEEWEAYARESPFVSKARAALAKAGAAP